MMRDTNPYCLRPCRISPARSCPTVGSLHCHEFGVFYAAARLEKLGIPVKTLCTLHATFPAGRPATGLWRRSGRTTQDGSRNPSGFAALEALARYADGSHSWGDSTMKEAMLFHRMKGMVIRNGIDVRGDRIDWDKKDAAGTGFRISSSRTSTRIARALPGKENIIPVFSISDGSENKGYPQLLDALVLQDHLLRHRITGQKTC